MLVYYLVKAGLHTEKNPRPPTQIASSRPIMYLLVDASGNVVISGAYLGYVSISLSLTAPMISFSCRFRPQKGLQDYGKCTAFGRAVPYKQLTDDDRIREVHADFALNLLRRCPEAEPVVSPVNAGVLLGQCACIAYGKTRHEILQLVLNGSYVSSVLILLGRKLGSSEK